MRISKQAFIDLFTPEEMQAILAAAKVYPAIEAWVFRFQNLTPESDYTSVDTEDQRTIDGLRDLEASGLLGEGRADQMLGASAVAAVPPPQGATVYRVGNNFTTCTAGEAGPAEYDESWPVSAAYYALISSGAELVATAGALSINARVM